jgi:hypothetical protein
LEELGEGVHVRVALAAALEVADEDLEKALGSEKPIVLGV